MPATAVSDPMARSGKKALLSIDEETTIMFFSSFLVMLNEGDAHTEVPPMGSHRRSPSRIFKCAAEA